MFVLYFGIHPLQANLRQLGIFLYKCSPGSEVINILSYLTQMSMNFRLPLQS